MAQTSICRGTATSVVCTTGRISVTYHNTLVVEVTPTHIHLDTGGWKTNTTRTRMNQASNQFDLGYQVYQKDFAWYVNWKGQTIPFTNKTITLVK